MADTTLVNFGKAVKTARLAASWTLEALAAEALGNPDRKGYCSQVEKGKRNLSESTIRGFARALDLPETVTDPLLNRALPADDQSEAEDATTERLLGEVETLRDKLKLSEALAVALAYKYAEVNPTDIEGALKGLEAAFETAAEQKARDALPSNIDDAVDKVLTEVARLNEEGNPEDADAFLMAEIDKANAEMERQKAQLERFYDRAIAQAVLTRDADAYAERQLLRIQLGTPNEVDQFNQLMNFAKSKYDDGIRRGTPFAIMSAIGLVGLCAKIAPSPLHRAQAKNNQAICLRIQSTRTEGERGTELLAQAVAAYDAALEVTTRQDHPLDWAETQNNKGNALSNQGIRTEGARGAALLAQAVEAYDTALKFFNQTEHPYEWAMTQNNKGTALKYQGTRKEGARGEDLLAQAVSAYDAALEVRTRQDHPVDWAATQNNKGNALQDQGSRTEGARGAALLAQAVAAYDAALEVRTRQDHPVDWAMTLNNKGNALLEQGIRTEGARGADLLAQAVAAYDAALEVRTRQDHPVDWATTQFNLAIAKEAWTDHDSAPDPRPLLSEALDHVDAALTIYDPEHMSYNYGNATRLRGRIHAKLDALP